LPRRPHRQAEEARFELSQSEQMRSIWSETNEAGQRPASRS